MIEYLLDTNHASQLLRNDQRLLARLEALSDARVGLCRPSIGELWFMVFNSRRIAENTEKLTTLCSALLIWEFDEASSVEFGRIRTELRQVGRPIPTIDVQIAGIARSKALTLLSSDRHFEAVKGLTVEDWLRPS